MQCAYSDLLANAKQLELAVDSRQVQDGGVFIAVPGNNCDGTTFVEDAVQHGCKYIVCQNEHVTALNQKYPHLQITGVDNVRQSVWQLAAAHYDISDSKLKILGITGTNGKTTCTYLLESLLQAQGYKVGVIGTINYRYPSYVKPAPLTTPDALTIHELLYKMAQAGCDYCVMEVSSHAIAQERVRGVPFAGCAFTNLTQDHLDFHQTMANYFSVKQRLFTTFGRQDKKCAINIDDHYGQEIAKLCPNPFTFGFTSKKHDPDLRADLLQANTLGCHLRMYYQDKTWELDSPLIGAFNAYNLLTVQALCLALGCEPKALQSLSAFKGVKGRLERVAANVFVDYAHTPDALENVLSALRQAGFKGIITVFGCGGNRDKTKRPLMGEVVARLSDVAVLTSDNPRFEDPKAILDDVLPGLQNAKEVVVNVDRKSATIAALNMLHDPYDCVLIAGKGHEDYQIINGNRFHYSDQEVVGEYFKCN